MTIWLRAIAVAVPVLPAVAGAFTLNQVLGFFNIIVGLFLTVAILSFGVGMILYMTRYGTWPREEAFPFMQFGITVLFVLSVLIALIHYFTKNTEQILYIISILVFICLGGLLLYAFKDRAEKKDKH